LKIIRSLFINKRNGQGSVTLPREVLDKLREDLRTNKYPKKISLEVLSPKEIVTNKIG